MKKLFLIVLFQLLYFFTYAQVVDTIIKMKSYSSYCSFQVKNPLVVVYNLYKGGGDCDRSHFHFKTNGVKKLASASDYSNSGYDIGHCANAEDFAYNCEYDESTFRFWNCMPQTKELNRGIWRTVEEKIRNISKTDSLIIMCGGFYGKKTIGKGVYVPDTCWKIVYSHSKKKIIMCYIFTNTTTPIMTETNVSTLNEMLKRKYKIDINSFIK